MNSIIFDTFDSYEDLGLILNNKIIGAPAPKILSLDIPGGDGALDYTEFFGKINYYNRELKFEFTMLGDHKEFLDRYSKILNLLNGRAMPVILSDDLGYYYFGRVIVNEWESEKRIGKIVIDVDAEPYKLKRAVTVVFRTITEETVINCPNSQKSVVPKISFVSEGAKGTISFGDYTTEKPFTTECPDNLVFETGQNIVKVTPTSDAVLPMSVRIEYQEGSL